MEKRQDFPDAALTQEKARQQIRARHKAWRMELPQEEVQEKSRKICERLAASDWYHNSAVIYGYYPLGAEADCLPFLAQFFIYNKQTESIRLHQKSGCSGTAAGRRECRTHIGWSFTGSESFPGCGRAPFM